MIREFNFVNHYPLEEKDLTVIVLISDCKNLNVHYYSFAYFGYKVFYVLAQIISQNL